jgi:hypothetical protein
MVRIAGGSIGSRPAHVGRVWQMCNSTPGMAKIMLHRSK